jgi:uncharacterized protein DUF3152
MTGSSDRTRAAARARHRGRRKSFRGQWFAVSALATLSAVMIAHPQTGNRMDLAARFGHGPLTTEVGQRPVVVPTQAPTSAPTLTMPLRPAPTLTRAPKPPKPAKPNVTRSTGKLSVVPGFAKATGQSGKLTYRLEIEEGLSFNAAAVAAAVQRTLTDPRGWQAIQNVHFERTDRADADLRIILATPTLTDQLCLPLQTGGEVSCRVENRVVLNAKRWMYAVPAYAGKVDLYRSYLVNHEVGHALGHGHSTCPKPNTPAPVMLQQTKGLGGCLPNAWPTVKAT